MSDEAGASPLDRVLDRMAHQLRNPLQSIVVNLEVVRLRASRDAPEVWESLSPFADAIDASVKLLDRRFRLLSRLGRTGSGPEEVDVGWLAKELVAALGLDEPPAPVRVESEAVVPAARARVGPLAGLLVLGLERLRSGQEEDGEVRVRVHAGSGKVFVDLGPAGRVGRDEQPEAGGEEGPRPLAEPSGPRAWDALVRAACESGAELRRVEGGGGARLRLALPRA